MDLKSHPVFGYILISLGLVAVGESYWIFNRYSANKKANTAWVAAVNEAHKYETTDPFPNDENAKLIAADLATSQAALDALKIQLKGVGPKAEAFLAAKVPATADDFVIQLTSFRNAELKKLGALKSVDSHNKVKESEAFGFAAYEKKGPPPELMEPIFRDKQIAEYLIDTLMSCPHLPDSFISLKREKAYSAADRLAYQKAYVASLAAGPPKPGAASAAPKLNEVSKDNNTNDLFPVDLLRSARVPNLVETTAFRISFESETITLREFLLQLSKFELPVIVRSVEWDLGSEGIADVPTPAAATDASTGSTGSAAPAKANTPIIVKPKPKVSQHLTKWTVEVEYIHLVTPLEPEAAPAAATSTKSSPTK